ncbi:MAG: DUF294 nucleotidyltransferase-like domain-containing protein [Pseudomonadota bacterium]
MTDQALEFLSAAPPFALLSKAELNSLSGKLVEIPYPAGTVLFRQGKSEVDRVLMVVSGSLELFLDKKDEIILRAFLKTGDVFGGISILKNNGLSLRTVKVVEDSVLLVVERDIFLDLCRRNKDFVGFFENSFRRRLRNESYASAIALSQARQFLAGVAPFNFLPDEELDAAAEQLSLAHYPKGALIFLQGQSPVPHLHIIQKGAAEQFVEEGDARKLHGLLGEGDAYGGISILLNNGLSVRTLRAVEDVFFYLLPKAAFLDISSRHEAFTEFYTDTFGKRMLDKSYAAAIAKTFQAEDEALQFFNQPVSNIANVNVVHCRTDATIQQAAAIMSDNGCSSIFLQDSSGEFVGILTDNDLRKKVIAEGRDINLPAAAVMTAPLRSISGQALVFEALLTMTRLGVKHLGILDSLGEVAGVVTQRDLLSAQEQSAFFLIREINAAQDLAEIIQALRRLPQAVQKLIKSGAKARNVTRLVTTISDAVYEKLITWAISRLGPPPVKFSFLILGSDGRKEQTLKTDQDNAIIYEDPPPELLAPAEKYFAEFGDLVCDWLDQAGYAFCNGGVMAKNPQWRQPLAKWKEYFAEWISKAEPEALLRSSIFFDFRSGYGEAGLVDELRAFLLSSLKGWAGFFRSLSENALHFKPPLGFFRNFVVESKGRHRNSFNIKSAMMPIVDMARIYALKNLIEETNTQERLYQVYLKKGLSQEDYQELEQAYGFLMQLRLVRQVSAVVDENGPPDNYINPKKLTRIEQTMIREIFVRIEKFQGKLGLDFLGVA